MTSTYMDLVRARLDAQQKMDLLVQERNTREQYLNRDAERMEIPYLITFVKYGAVLGAIAASIAGPAFWIEQYVFPDHLLLGAVYGVILGVLIWLGLRIYVYFDDRQVDWDLASIESSDITAQCDILSKYERRYKQIEDRYHSAAEEFCTQPAVRSVAAHLAARFEKNVRSTSREPHIRLVQVPLVLLVKQDRILVVQQKPAAGKEPSVLETLLLSTCGISALQDDTEQAALARALGLLIRLEMCRRLPYDPISPTGQPTEVTIETGGNDVTLCYKAINGNHLKDCT